MRFARAIWKLLVGVKDALVLIFMLMFFGLLYAGLSAKPTPVGEGVLALDLDGAVVEQPSKADVSEVFSGGDRPTDYRLRDLIAVLEKAKTDDRVKAVALDLDGFTGGGQTTLGDLSDAVERLKKTATAKFDETVEVAMSLGVDPRHAEQQVRGTVVLPHGTGKKIRVLVLTKGDKEREAKDAGADYAGSEEFIKRLNELPAGTGPKERVSSHG